MVKAYSKKKRFFSGFLFAFALIVSLIVYSYSQFYDKKTVLAVLQQELNLESTQGKVYAIVTKPQKLPSGRNLPVGTRLIGRLQKNTDGVIEVNYEKIEWTDGSEEKFIGKTVFNRTDEKNIGGVSSKIGKTFQSKTRSSVLGAIFTNTSGPLKADNSYLPRGTAIKIEVE